MALKNHGSGWGFSKRKIVFRLPNKPVSFFDGGREGTNVVSLGLAFVDVPQSCRSPAKVEARACK